MPRVNPKPLSILVLDTALFTSPVLEKYKQKGHHVECIDLSYIIDEKLGSECDVIIGSRCWRIDPRMKLGDDKTEDESLERQLGMMEAGVRAIKFPKRGKDEG